MDQANGLRHIVRKGQLAKRKSPGTKSVPRVIAVTSGKGGVGKTNLVGNLAIALSQRGKKVVVLDADVGLGNIDIIFNLRPRYNISQVIAGEMSLSDVMVTTRHGVKIIPAGSGFANLTQLADGEKLNLLNAFERLSDTIDIVLVDTGAGISSNVLYFNSAADESIVVATNEPTSITDAYALMKVLSREYGTRYFKLVVNMVRSDKDAKLVYGSLSGALDRFLGNVVLEYFGFIGHDPMIKKAVMNRTPVIDFAGTSPSAAVFKDFAEKLVKSPRRTNADGNITFFMKKLFNAADQG
ncbi:MAG: MinD/ParA family protein [Thermodesulfobacteriota bacterium]|nr:MinD/ParA family protein [Thermodesulfobacteriota bacterium]